VLDKHLVPHLRAPLARVAGTLHQRGISADTVSVAGFVCGLLAVLLVALGATLAALVLLLLGRLADGLDGEIARINGSTDAGAFLDIVLDFIFYALFAAFCLMCLFPSAFALIAWIFAAVCWVTTVNRVVSGYRTLKR